MSNYNLKINNTSAYFAGSLQNNRMKNNISLQNNVSFGMKWPFSSPKINLEKLQQDCTMESVSDVFKQYITKPLMLAKACLQKDNQDCTLLNYLDIARNKKNGEIYYSALGQAKKYTNKAQEIAGAVEKMVVKQNELDAILKGIIFGNSIAEKLARKVMVAYRKTIMSRSLHADGGERIFGHNSLGSKLK